MSQPISSAPHDISSPQGKKLLDQLSDAIRLKRYSYCTEETYIDWIRPCIIHHGKKHPRDMGVSEVQVFVACQIRYLHPYPLQ